MNNKYLPMLVILTVLSFMIGFSYAYYTPVIIGNNTASTHNTTLGTLKLTYNGTNKINLANVDTGGYAQTTFTVKNTGTEPIASYQIFFSNLTNTFTNNEAVYQLTCSSSDAVSCTSKGETAAPTSAGLMHTQGSIAPNTTHTYTFRVTFKEMGYRQDYNKGKQFKTKIICN